MTTTGCLVLWHKRGRPGLRPKISFDAEWRPRRFCTDQLTDRFFLVLVGHKGRAPQKERQGSCRISRSAKARRRLAIENASHRLRPFAAAPRPVVCRRPGRLKLQFPRAEGGKRLLSASRNPLAAMHIMTMPAASKRNSKLLVTSNALRFGSSVRRKLGALAFCAAVFALFSQGGWAQTSFERAQSRSTARQASEASISGANFYVPMDWWIYEALDRLAALGLVPSQTSGMRPWLVDECIRQTAEARKLLERGALDRAPDMRAFALQLLKDLEAELEKWAPNNVFRLDALSHRSGAIAGEPLRDGYHLGQTWTNDSGRPIIRGYSSITAVMFSAGHNRISAHFRGELQTSGQAPAVPPHLQQMFARLDGIPDPFEPRLASGNRTRVQEAYAMYRHGNWALSAGKQALWYGPSYDAPLHFSTNAEAPELLRLSSVSPFRIPGFSHLVGPLRVEFTLGRLGGHQWTWKPWLNSQKITVKPFNDVEFGFTRWSIFWGTGHPRTWRTFVRNLFSLTSPQTPVPSSLIDPTDPGDRKAGLDFRWRLPRKAKIATLYGDFYSEDDASPLANFSRAAIATGIFVPSLPGTSHQDLRLEMSSTVPLGSHEILNYWNNQYRSGNTNMGYLVGSWTGRAGRALSAWTGKSLGGGHRWEVGYQHFKVDGRFLEGGATQNRVQLRYRQVLAGSVHLECFAQWERYLYPVLGPSHRTLSGWMAISWRPAACLAFCGSKGSAGGDR